MPFNRETIFNTGIPIKIALIKANMFQVDAAKALGIPMTSFNMKLLGRRVWLPDERTRLAELLGEDESALFAEYDQQDPSQGDNNECEENTQERVA